MQINSRCQLILASSILLGAACIVVGVDPYFHYKWFAFLLWNMSMLLCVLGLIPSRVTLPQTPPRWHIISVALLILLLSSRFMFLVSYPFSGMGDANRDGGLRPEQLALGAWDNIFGFDWSQGLTMATYLSLLYHLFPPDLLLIRVPAAVVSCLDIVILYCLATKIGGWKEAFFAAIAMICCHYHWYYGRTEILIGCTGLLTSLLLLLLTICFSSRDIRAFGAIGLVIGFALGFHASIYAVAGLCACISVAIIFEPIVRGRTAPKKNSTRHAIRKALLLFTCCLIGYGPRILYSQHFFANFASQASTNFDAGRLLSKYAEALKVLFITPSQLGHFPGYPFFSGYAGLLLIIGGLSAICRPRFTHVTALAFLLLIPLLNGSLSHVAKASEYRLFPVISAGCVLIGGGASQILCLFNCFNSALTKHPCRSLTVAGLSSVLLAATFFAEQSYRLAQSFMDGRAANPLNRQDTVYEYLVTDLARIAQQHSAAFAGKTICIITDKSAHEYLALQHVREYFEFFFFRWTIESSPLLQREEIPAWQILWGPCPDRIPPVHFQIFDFERDALRYRLLVEER